MKTKILLILLILFSLIGYLEWGQNSRQFLFEVEFEVFSKLLTNPSSVMHPFVILPFVGQIILVFNIAKKKPNPLLSYIGIGGIGVLFLMILFIGILSANIKIIAFSLPFLITAVATILHSRKEGSAVTSN